MRVVILRPFRDQAPFWELRKQLGAQEQDCKRAL